VSASCTLSSHAPGQSPSAEVVAVSCVIQLQMLQIHVFVSSHEVVRASTGSGASL
jgi:hypothetical protein